MAKLTNANRFGWKPSSPDQISRNMQVEFSDFGLAVPARVEKQFNPHREWDGKYTQSGGSCVGFGTSRAISAYNHKVYDGMKLYRQAQKIDGDDRTNNINDGTYGWAGAKVAQDKGMVLHGQSTWLVEEGIKEYRSIDPRAGTIDQLRTAYSVDQVNCVGVLWFPAFDYPTRVNNELYMGEQNNWGSPLGGHWIWNYWCSDDREAMCFINTWGPEWEPRWMKYRKLERLFGYGAEIIVYVDRIFTPPPPPPIDLRATKLTIEGLGSFSGAVARVK